jgi:signal transduction histidine kinase
VADLRSFREGSVFTGAVKQVDDLTEISNFMELQRKVDEFNNTYNDYGIILAVHEEIPHEYPLSQNGNHVIIDDGNAVYSVRAGEYTLLLTASGVSINIEPPFNDFFYIGLVLFIFSLIIVFIVNRALTRFVSNKITTPLELMASGVHELRDGNLKFRIEYNSNDEFKSVCDDFNEMAKQLHDVVTARQKDEKSRKELIAGISHDLRTPLTSIKAYIEGIEKGVASTPETQKKYLDTIKGKTEELERIINQLFLFSKLDIGEFPLKIERVEMNETLREFTCEAASEYKNDGLELRFTESTNELYANIDILQFRNVLGNILGNSAKYKTDSVVNSEITCTETGEGIVITVIDNGPGVPANSVDKLFDVFYRDDVSRKDPSNGSGLGLAIARKIIERLGGTIYAENVPAGGLAIIIKLPEAGGTV